MRYLDVASWQGLLVTLLGLALITLIGVGIRLLIMQTIQQRRERGNRQINERLKTLIAAYKTLGGFFTGDLSVRPGHGQPSQHEAQTQLTEGEAVTQADGSVVLPNERSTRNAESSERARQIRTAVEAALSDVILLGTDEQVQLAARAATEMAEGRPIHTAEVVVSLRSFIRDTLDLNPIPDGLEIPKQGPLRPATSSRSGEGPRAGAGGRGAGVTGGGGMGMMGMGAAGMGASQAIGNEPGAGR